MSLRDIPQLRPFFLLFLLSLLSSKKKLLSYKKKLLSYKKHNKKPTEK